MESIFRVGIGYDVHCLVKGRRLYLGGIEIDSEFGLLGHSDGDVLFHAVSDALLGSCGLLDIGHFFPPQEPKWQGVRSSIILEKSYQIIKKKNFRVNNIDSVIIAAQPRISPYIPAMKDKISQILEIEIEKVGIKATTPERLGALGRGEGIAAWSIVSVIKYD
jgi:2-C-methyl-D-erythritol 2,4-cyclodiphosphate synthase